MITETIHGVELISKDDMVCLSNLRNGAFEPETFEFFKEILEHRKQGNDNPVFVDVGAYSGLYSIFAAKMGYEVVAFEPNARVYDRLLENVHLNDVEITTMNCALSNVSGISYLNHNPNVALTSGGSLESTVNANKAAQKVSVLHYDVEQEFPLPDVIKIDVEGHEISVLSGMVQSIKAGDSFVIVEANTEHHRKELEAWFSGTDLDFIGVFDERNLIFGPKL